MARENPPLASLAIFHTRCLSDCSSCIRPPYLAIVADMLTTYKKLVGISSNEFRQWPPPYTLLYPPLRRWTPVLSTGRDTHHDIRLQKFQSWQHHDVRFRGVCGQIPLWIMKVSCSGRKWIGHWAPSVYPLFVIRLVDHQLQWYDMNILTSNCLLFLILAAASFTKDF
jgi:hypothetical protein